MVTFFVDYMERHKRDYAALDLEMNNLFAALEVAFERGMKASLVRGAIASYDFLQARGLYERAKVDLSRAEQAARELGDQVGLVAILRNLGRIANKQGRYGEAQALFEQALTLARQTENLVPILTEGRKEGKAQISALLTSLGALAHRRANYVQAKAHYDEAITLAKQAVDEPRLVALQTNLGLLAAEQGNHEQAESIYKEALQLVRRLDNQKRLTTILRQNLGGLMHDCGKYERAKKHFQEGLALADEIGDPELRSRLLANLGLVTYALQDYPAANKLFNKGLELAQQNQLPLQISRQLANLGLMATTHKNYDQANQHYQEALTLARQSGFPKNICGILNRWGDSHLAQQNLPQAEAAFREALETAQKAKLQQQVAKSLYGLARIAAKPDKPKNDQD
jgi:tetratricopeptide (TPR) repeat protein